MPRAARVKTVPRGVWPPADPAVAAKKRAAKFKLKAWMPSEDDIHLSVAAMLRMLIGPEGETNALGVIWYTVEHRNARNAIEGAKRKKRGVVPGLPDIYTHFAGATHLIEMKDDDGVLSDAQKKRHPELRRAGLTVDIARTVPEVVASLEARGIPLLGRLLPSGVVVINRRVPP
jgi:hypothetical protein